MYASKFLYLEEIVDLKAGEEKPVKISVDDDICPSTSVANLAKFKTIFKKDGTTTGGMRYHIFLSPTADAREVSGADKEETDDDMSLITRSEIRSKKGMTMLLPNRVHLPGLRCLPRRE
ncbi:hypothetical protein ACFE04_022443 [Oxalis oulophora]